MDKLGIIITTPNKLDMLKETELLDKFGLELITDRCYEQLSELSYKKIMAYIK